MSVNKEELEVPEWLNANFLETVLNNAYESDNVKVNDIKISSPAPPSDHYASKMFRVTFKYILHNKTNEISLIVKAIPKNEEIKNDILDLTDVFDVETTMYAKIFPQIFTLLKNAGQEKPITARLFYYALSPCRVMVFEDLKRSGYEMLPRAIPTQNEVNMIIVRLAEFHAASYKMAADGNTVITKFKNASFNIPLFTGMDCFRHAFDGFKRVISHMKDCEIYAKKLEPITFDALLSKCVKECNTLGPFNVLNHGDFHIRNMMFKLNEDKSASDVVLIDFQLCHWGSAALDLCYAKMFNPYETRKGLNDLYYNAFTEVLKDMKFNGKIPTFSDLTAELKRFQCVELYLYILVFPFMSYEEKIDMNDLVETPAKGAVLYANNFFRKTTREMLPIYLEEGYFDL